MINAVKRLQEEKNNSKQIRAAIVDLEKIKEYEKLDEKGKERIESVNHFLNELEKNNSINTSRMERVEQTPHMYNQIATTLSGVITGAALAGTVSAFIAPIEIVTAVSAIGSLAGGILGAVYSFRYSK